MSQRSAMTMRRPAFGPALGLVAAACLTLSCGGERGAQAPEEAGASSAGGGPETNPEAGIGAVVPAVAPELGVDLSTMRQTESGLFVQDLHIGEGEEATAGDAVVVHYTGWLTDGTEFDSSLARDEPFTFDLGAGRVIAGWDEGVHGMREGGRRQLLIPPGLAYGEAGLGPIPGNASLVFEVQLLGVRREAP